MYKHWYECYHNSYKRKSPRTPDDVCTNNLLTLSLTWSSMTKCKSKFDVNFPWEVICEVISIIIGVLLKYYYPMSVKRSRLLG